MIRHIVEEKFRTIFLECRIIFIHDENFFSVIFEIKQSLIEVKEQFFDYGKILRKKTI